jgi:hypothetical protein
LERNWRIRADVTVEEIKGFSDFQILVEDVEILIKFAILCFFLCICEWDGSVRDNCVRLKLDLAWDSIIWAAVVPMCWPVNVVGICGLAEFIGTIAAILSRREFTWSNI